MKTYLLTAAGVIFLMVLISFIVPDGKMKKSVSFVLRLVSIAVLVQPLTGIFKFSQNTADMKYDYDYVCSVYAQNQSNLVTQKIQDELGYDDCVCVVEIVYDGAQIKENGVTVQSDYADEKKIATITEYLQGLGYINITVNEKAT